MSVVLVIILTVDCYFVCGMIYLLYQPGITTTTTTLKCSLKLKVVLTRYPACDGTGQSGTPLQVEKRKSKGEGGSSNPNFSGPLFG